jgi:outer membrane protein OmpA-like peptidoglycan-associated protein
MKPEALFFLLSPALMGQASSPPNQPPPAQSAAPAETSEERLRARLRRQFEAILETRETARGLLLNGDALFDADQSVLKQDGKEKLARLSGMLLAYPGLKVRVEAPSASQQAASNDAKPCAERAHAVQDDLLSQNVADTTIGAIPENAGADEAGACTQIVVSGKPIGLEDPPRP